MESAQIVPSKIHLTNIKTVKENTVLFNGKLDVKPTYDIQVSHNMMHNLDKELVLEFLSGDYSKQFLIENSEQYKIQNVCIEFINLIR